MLTFESESRQGVQPIVEKLTVSNFARMAGLFTDFPIQSLAFSKVRHSVSTKDAQPNGRGGVILLVTGHLFVR